MPKRDFDKDTEAITLLVSDLYDVNAVYRQGNDLAFSLSWRYAPVKSKKLLSDRLQTAGYRYTLTDGEDVLLVVDPRRRLKIPKLNVFLFIATVLSVYILPVLFSNTMAEDIWAATLDDLRRGAGLQFAVALISILLVHEMGHFLASRRRHIITSWPYFLPAPNLLGTFGAIIKSKSPFYNRRDLIEVGAAGPIAGWIVAFGWLIYGLSQSNWLPVGQATAGQWAFGLDGESILMRLAVHALVGAPVPDHFLQLTEGAFAGWVGLLVTAINLLPIGQLDGGHVLYGLFRRTQHALGFFGLLTLLVLGYFSPIWWLFGAFGLIFGVKHPPTLDDERPLSPVARWMGIAAITIMILSFTPMPFPSPF